MKTPRLRGAWRGVSSAHSALRREGIDRRWAGGTPVFARTFWGDVGPRALRLSDTIDRPVCLPVQWNPLIFPNQALMTVFFYLIVFVHLFIFLAGYFNSATGFALFCGEATVKKNACFVSNCGLCEKPAGLSMSLKTGSSAGVVFRSFRRSRDRGPSDPGLCAPGRTIHPFPAW